MKWEVSSSYFYVLENQRMFGVKPRNEFWRCHFWGHVDNFSFLLATFCVNIKLDTLLLRGHSDVWPTQKGETKAYSPPLPRAMLFHCLSYL